LALETVRGPGGARQLCTFFWLKFLEDLTQIPCGRFFSVTNESPKAYAIPKSPETRNSYCVDLNDFEYLKRSAGVGNFMNTIGPYQFLGFSVIRQVLNTRLVQ